MRHLTTWTNDFGTTIETIDYKTFLIYLESLNKKGIVKRTIVGYLKSLTHYFGYLQHENHRVDNPIENLKIKGVPKTVVKNTLDFEELEYLYYGFESEKATCFRKRNKIILGLLIYQGLRTQDIFNLKVEDINLQKGQITIAGTRKSNGRVLPLVPWQFMDLIEYVNQIRPEIIHKENQNSDQFFLSEKGKLTIRNSLTSLQNELKSLNRNYQSFEQIRSSVIVYWLGQFNLRRVQYLAGHRYISSTERYKQTNLESLQEMITAFHPIG